MTATEMEANAERCWQSLLRNPCSETLHGYYRFWKELAKDQRERERELIEEPLFRREWAL